MLVFLLRKAYLKQPVHFQKIPSFTSLNHMVQICAFLLGNKVDVVLVIYIVVYVHFSHVFGVFVEV